MSYQSIPPTPRAPRAPRYDPARTIQQTPGGSDIPDPEAEQLFDIQSARAQASEFGENLLGHFNNAVDTAKGHFSNAKDKASQYNPYATPQKPAGYTVPTPQRPAHYGGGQENLSTPPTSPRRMVIPGAPLRPRPRPIDREVMRSAPPRALFTSSASRRLRQDKESQSPAQGGKRYKKHGKKSKKAKKTTKKKRTHKKRKSHHKKTHHKRR